MMHIVIAAAATGWAAHYMHCHILCALSDMSISVYQMNRFNTAE